MLIATHPPPKQQPPATVATDSIPPPPKQQPPAAVTSASTPPQPKLQPHPAITAIHSHRPPTSSALSKQPRPVDTNSTRSTRPPPPPNQPPTTATNVEQMVTKFVAKFEGEENEIRRRSVEDFKKELATKIDVFKAGKLLNCADTLDSFNVLLKREVDNFLIKLRADTQARIMQFKVAFLKEHVCRKVEVVLRR
jgi:hypothetical protein